MVARNKATGDYQGLNQRACSEASNDDELVINYGQRWPNRYFAN